MYVFIFITTSSIQTPVINVLTIFLINLYFGLIKLHGKGVWKHCRSTPNSRQKNKGFCIWVKNVLVSLRLSVKDIPKKCVIYFYTNKTVQIHDFAQFLP